MQKKQVAIIDIGSSKITAIVGERGINKTFVIKGRFSREYDGFSDGLFFDVNNFTNALKEMGDCVFKTSRNDVSTVYVGVPSEFTKVFVKDSQISFSKKKKITTSDVDMLFEAAFVLSSTQYTLINRSAIVYELDDFRRLANPVGATSEILNGKLSFILCSNYFIEAVKPVLTRCGFDNVECVSSSLCESLYLIDGETRDRISILLDVGYITSTFTIIQGDGILYQDTFEYGGGYITAELVERYNIDFDVAERIKRKVNLCTVSTTAFDVIDGENGDYYPISEVRNSVLNSLDNLCENISDSLENAKINIPDYVPILLTGGGISYIRGAKEHISSRIEFNIEVVSPNVPLSDKPTESSVLSLLDLALEQA